MQVRSLLGGERPWLVEVLAKRWGADYVVARGEVIPFARLEALVAVGDDGKPAGVLGYRLDRESLEIVSLDAFVEGAGVGAQLVARAREVAETANLRRIWLVTTNENLRALAFYVTHGFSLAAVHMNAVAWSREVKPEIPLLGTNGVPITDELELEILLDATGPPKPNLCS